MWFEKLRTKLSAKFPSVFTAEMSEAELDEALDSLDEDSTMEALQAFQASTTAKLTANAASVNTNFELIQTSLTALITRVSDLETLTATQAVEITTLSEAAVAATLSEETVIETAAVKALTDDILLDTSKNAETVVKMDFESFMGIKQL